MIAAPVLAPVLRKRCCFCPTPHPTDGLGPIRPDEIISDGMCAAAFAKVMAELDAKEVAQAGAAQ